RVRDVPIGDRHDPRLLPHEDEERLGRRRREQRLPRSREPAERQFDVAPIILGSGHLNVEWHYFLAFLLGFSNQPNKAGHSRTTLTSSLVLKTTLVDGCFCV